MKGRKRHILVDILGLILAVLVLPADVQDRDAALLLLRMAEAMTGRVLRMWADANYSGYLVDWVWWQLGWILEIVTRSPDTTGFAVQPKRWIVERTLAGLGKCRRLAKDYEEQPATSETWIYAAMSHILVRRLACT